MSGRPILFNGAMVREVLGGSKTQTRRVVTPRTSEGGVWSGGLPGDGYDLDSVVEARLVRWNVAPPYPITCRVATGDRLWVRETHALVPATAYRASREPDGGPVPHRTSPDGYEWAIYREGWTRCAPSRWRPSIHMPRWASRITLEVTGVRVERVQDISDADARAEGVMTADASYREAFAVLWDSINGKRPGCSWASNPWVWAVTFRLDGGES